MSKHTIWSSQANSQPNTRNIWFKRLVKNEKMAKCKQFLIQLKQSWKWNKVNVLDSRRMCRDLIETANHLWDLFPGVFSARLFTKVPFASYIHIILLTRCLCTFVFLSCMGSRDWCSCQIMYCGFLTLKSTWRLTLPG